MDDNAREALVERVAEIMACADLWPTAWHGTHSLPPMPEPERNLWRERARAALAVIEPVVREDERSLKRMRASFERGFPKEDGA